MDDHYLDTKAEMMPKGAQLVSYTARLLRALAQAPAEGLRIVELVKATGLERATVTRVVGALCAERLASAIGEAGRQYVLGPLAFELGLVAGRRFPLREIAAPSLDRLAQATGDTCFLMIRSGSDAVCIDRREGTYPVKALTIGVGDRRPMGAAAASIALLMHLPPPEVDAHLAANAARIEKYGMLTAAVVRSMVQRARSLGFALNHDNIIPEVSAVGVAIPARVGPPFSALSVSALTSRMMPQDRYREIVERLREEAAVIAARL